MINPKEISISEYDYELPDERIARHPLEQRDKCKLLVKSGDSVTDTLFFNLSEYLPEDSMLVYNNTRVINARLRFNKGENNDGALIEIFCLEPVSPRDYERNFESQESVQWLCIVGNSKKWKDGILTMPLIIDGKKVILSAERIEKLERGDSIVEFRWNDNSVTFASIISAAGEIPIPPYLNRKSEESDSTDYQTVYSHIDGSVAAPTAGLHFTPDVLSAIDEKRIPRREVTLHVGAGTFQPVKSEKMEGHGMHNEFISVDKKLIEELSATDRKVIAVGTTTVRTLESLYHAGCLLAENKIEGTEPQWYPYERNHPQLSVKDAFGKLLEYMEENKTDVFCCGTKIIIAPGYQYKVVKGMVTNFHQPRSTLLLLVSAFIGDRWRDLYAHALENGYRFLSYGDAMLLI